MWPLLAALALPRLSIPHEWEILIFFSHVAYMQFSFALPRLQNVRQTCETNCAFGMLHVCVFVCVGGIRKDFSTLTGANNRGC